jgi:hypothetical protein
MPFSFPSSPSVGDLSTQNGRQYRYAGNNAWELVAASSGLTWSAVPASATASGTAGQIAYDSQYQYICVATNTWARISLAAFTPARIPGLQLWLDAGDSWTLFDATSGGSTTAANGIVKRWEDKSGYARHATESTNGPTRKTAVQNGIGTLDFDGTNDTLQIANSQSVFAFLHKSSRATMFIVYRPTYTLGGDEFHTILDTGANSGLAPGITLAFNNNSPNSQMIDWRVAGADGGIVRRRIDGGAPNNSFSLQSIVTDNANATSESRALLYRNGGSNSGTNVTGGPFDGGTVSTGNAGRNFTMSGTGTATGASSAAFFNGDIGEIIIYNSALSDADRGLVESYLASRWGIS